MKALILILLLINTLSISSCRELGKANKITDAYSDSLRLFLENANNEKLTKRSRILFTEKALHIVNRERNDSLQIINLFKISNRYWNLDYLNHYKATVQVIIHKAEKNNDFSSSCKAYLYMAQYYQHKNLNDSAFYYIVKCEKLAKSLKNGNILTDIYTQKLALLLYNSEYMLLEKTAFDLLALKKYSPESEFLGFNSLGIAYENMGDFDNSEKYYRQALNSCIKLQDRDYKQATTFNNLGSLYLKSGHFREAKKVLTQALKIKQSDRRHYARILTNLSAAKLKLGELRSTDSIEIALEIRDSLNLVQGVVDCKLLLAEFNLKNGDTLTAKCFAKEAYYAARFDNTLKEILNPLKMLWSVEPDKAQKYATEYTLLSDSIKKRDYYNRNKFARIEYETEELEKQIKKVKYEQATLSQFGIVSLFVLLTATVLWWQHVRTKELAHIREKNAQNNQIFDLLDEGQQKLQQGKNIEKNRIARELHDGVMGKLTSIRLNLFALKKDKSPATIEKCILHIESIHDIEKEIRAIAYDLGTGILSNEVSFIAIIKNLLDSIQEHADIKMSCETAGVIPWEAISNNAKMQVYRIIQESLHNIEKHAQAKNVLILITATNKHITFEIRDDGAGFCKKTIKKGFGLRNIYGRARTINARVRVVSVPDKGTTISVTVPLENNPQKPK